MPKKKPKPTPAKVRQRTKKLENKFSHAANTAAEICGLVAPTDPQELLAWSRNILGEIASDTTVEPRVRSHSAQALQTGALLEIRYRDTKPEKDDEPAPWENDDEGGAEIIQLRRAPPK